MAKFRLSMFHLSKSLNAMFRLSTSISTYVLLALLAGGSSWAVEVEEEEGPWWSLLPLVKPAVPDDNPLSPPCIPPNPGFRDLSYKRKFLAVFCQEKFPSSNSNFLAALRPWN